MSIITDTLARVQSERAAGTQGDEEGGEVQEPHGSSRRPVAKKSSKGGWNLRYVAVIVLGLSGLALGTYWWGLTLVPDIPQFSQGPQSSKVPAERQPIDESMKAPMVPVELSTPSGPPTSSSLTAEPSIGSSRESLDLPSSSQDASQDISSSFQEKEPKELPPTIGGKPTESMPKEKAGQQVAASQDNVKSPVTMPLGPSPLPPSLSLEERLNDAQSLIAQQEYRKAVELLRPLFAGTQERWEPWFWLGTAQLGMHQLEVAENSFREGLARDSTIPHLWVQQALVAQQHGHYNEAIDSLRQAEMLAPNLPEIALNLAYSLDRQGDTRHADHYYRKFLSLTEGTIRYHSARLKVLARLTHTDGRQ